MPKARILALAAIAAAVLAGCGSASPSGSADAERSGAELAVAQSPFHSSGSATEAGGYIVKSSDPIYEKKPPRVLSYPTGRDTDETSATGAAPVVACSLVSHGRAAAILGGPVEFNEEPQGPTCIYARRDSKRQVTLTVENTRLTSLRGHARKASRIRLAGRNGWCLRYESTSVAVALGPGLILHVTGPSCPLAARFAARALPHAG